jgi:hypothetical protein
LAQLQRQRHAAADAQHSGAYLDLNVTTPDGGVEALSVVFADADKRTKFEEEFAETKDKLGQNYGIRLKIYLTHVGMMLELEHWPTEAVFWS